ncbi:unnamed protein product [Closterium sp. NIES-54]
MSPMGTPCQPTESTLSRNSRGVAELPDGSTWLSVVARHAGELQSIQQQLQRSDVARGLHVLRVNQMDALRLDDEMRLMLKEQLMRVVALVPAAWVARGEAELELLLDVLVWRFSLWADRPLPGCALMNLRFRDERTPRAGAGAAAPPAVPVRTGVEGPGLTVGQKVLWLVLTGGVKYVWARLHSTHWLLPVHAHMPHNAYARHGSGSEALQRQQASWRHWLWRLLHRAEGAVKLASLLNLVVFLHSAKFRTLPERLLGIRAVYAKPHMARAVSFEYMNRQLVWNEFSELLLLVLPLISVSAIKHTFSSLFRLPSSSSPTAGDGCPALLSAEDCSASGNFQSPHWPGMGHAPSPAIHAVTASRVGIRQGELTWRHAPRDSQHQRGMRLATSFLPPRLATSLKRLPAPLQRAHSPPCGDCSAPRGCARAAWRGDGQADRRKIVACRAAESGDVVPADWVDTAGTHKRPRQVFYSKKVRHGPFNGDKAGGEWGAEGGGGGMVRASSEAR